MKLVNEDDVIQPLLALQHGWDSYGASVISPKVIQMLRRATIDPRTDGGVSIEFDAEGMEWTLDFRPDGTVESIYHERTKKEHYEHE